MVKVAELTEQEKVIANLKKQVNDIPRSKRPNGKVQKTGQSKRFSVLTTQNSQKSNWDKKMSIKQERKNIKSLESKIKETNKALKPQPKPKSTAQTKKVEPVKVTKASLRKEKRSKKKKEKIAKKKAATKTKSKK